MDLTGVNAILVAQDGNSPLAEIDQWSIPLPVMITDLEQIFIYATSSLFAEPDFDLVVVAR